MADSRSLLRLSESLPGGTNPDRVTVVVCGSCAGSGRKGNIVCWVCAGKGKLHA